MQRTRNFDGYEGIDNEKYALIHENLVGTWEWSMMALVVRLEDKALLFVTDSGCSCNDPWEGGIYDEFVITDDTNGFTALGTALDNIDDDEFDAVDKVAVMQKAAEFFRARKNGTLNLGPDVVGDGGEGSNALPACSGEDA